MFAGAPASCSLYEEAGHILFTGQLDMHDSGYLKTKPGTTQTNIPGVLACDEWSALMKFDLRYVLFLAVVGCSSSSPAASSSSTTTDAGDGGNSGGTTQVSGTVNGTAWQGISADLTAAKLGNETTKIKISTADACTDSGSNVLELDLPATPATGTFTVTGGGTPPAAIFDLPAGNNTVEELVTSGTITITNVTSSEIDGSFNLTLSTTTQTAEGSLQGTFSAPLCGD